MVFVGISCLNIAINRDHSFRSPCVMLIPVRWINNAVFCFPVWHSAVMLLVEAANFNMSSYYCLSLYRHHSLLMPFTPMNFYGCFQNSGHPHVRVFLQSWLGVILWWNLNSSTALFFCVQKASHFFNKLIFFRAWSWYANFPKIGGDIPPNHQLKNRVFHDFHHPFLETPIFLYDMIIITIPGYPPWNQPIAPLKNGCLEDDPVLMGGKRGPFFKGFGC